MSINCNDGIKIVLQFVFIINYYELDFLSYIHNIGMHNWVSVVLYAFDCTGIY